MRWHGLSECTFDVLIVFFSLTEWSVYITICILDLARCSGATPGIVTRGGSMPTVQSACSATRSRLSRTLWRSSCVVALLAGTAGANSAMAQDSNASVEQVVVTGSRVVTNGINALPRSRPFRPATCPT